MAELWRQLVSDDQISSLLRTVGQSFQFASLEDISAPVSVIAEPDGAMTVSEARQAMTEITFRASATDFHLLWLGQKNFMMSFKHGDLLIEGPFHGLFEVSWPIRRRARQVYPEIVLAYRSRRSFAYGLGPG